MSVIRDRVALCVLKGRFGVGSFSFSLSAATSLSCEAPVATSPLPFMAASEEIPVSIRKGYDLQRTGAERLICFHAYSATLGQ